MVLEGEDREEGCSSSSTAMPIGVPPGPTMHTMSHTGDLALTFHLFVTPSVENIILEMTNWEGCLKYGYDWKGMDETDLRAWVACDAKSSYAWNMQVYTRKPSGGHPELNQGLQQVLDITEGLHGRNVTCNNYFISYELSRSSCKERSPWYCSRKEKLTGQNGPLLLNRKRRGKEANKGDTPLRKK